MEERKLAIDVQRRDMSSSHVMKLGEEQTQLDLKANFSESVGTNDNWFELRFNSLGPDRRGYHSTFIHNKRMYIYGGHDIREGSKESLWMLDLRKLKEMEGGKEQETKDSAWKEVAIKGDDRPGPLAHHTSVVYGDKMFLFGGSNLEAENRKFFSLDLNHFRWDVVKSRGDLPITRDEHTAVLYENEQSMIIFGGFMNGQRTNEIVKYIFQENRWQKLNMPEKSVQPSARSGHTAVVYEHAMWVFGGKDEDNNKLNDLWRLDLNTYTWKEVKPSDEHVPLERSGHSCDLYENYMVIFGGIYEITKELNDIHLYDFKNNRWITLFEESNSPVKFREMSPMGEDSSPYGNTGSLSPAKRSPAGRKSTLKAVGSSPPKTSQQKLMKPVTSSSQVKKQLNLNTSTMSQSRNQGGGTIHGGGGKTSMSSALTGIQLTTPTSISMMNSFIIKNADTSFDHYYQSMKKRKQFNNNSTFTNQNNISHSNIQNGESKSKGKRPAARDGHTGIVFGKHFIVFGGDRHHMPFNDTFILDLKAETISKGYLFH